MSQENPLLELLYKLLIKQNIAVETITFQDLPSLETNIAADWASSNSTSIDSCHIIKISTSTKDVPFYIFNLFVNGRTAMRFLLLLKEGEIAAVSRSILD